MYFNVKIGVSLEQLEDFGFDKNLENYDYDMKIRNNIVCPIDYAECIDVNLYAYGIHKLLEAGLIE